MTARKNVRIDVQNFGPISSGSVDLRPLTVFVGRSNAGKTYFSTLIYALHKTLSGFPLLPMFEEPDAFDIVGLAGDENVKGSVEEFKDVFQRVNSNSEPLMFSDMPIVMQSYLEDYLQDDRPIMDVLVPSLFECFDVDHISRLIRRGGNSDDELPNDAKISVSVSNGNEGMWRLDIDSFLSEKPAGEVKILNHAILPNIDSWNTEQTRRLKSLPAYLKDIASFVDDEPEEHRLDSQAEVELYTYFSALRDILYEGIHYDDDNGYADIYYLPAARSSIMQTHRIIASAFVTLFTERNREYVEEMPSITKPIADFIRMITLYGRTREPSGHIKDIIDSLEKNVLGGEIQISQSILGSPKFTYRPNNTQETFHLTQVSSMVSELSPLVLRLKLGVSLGDTLIIEEPEAHLHPAAQAEMAGIIALIVNAGIRVILTTHSDWILQEIGNLMRVGVLEKEGVSLSDQGLSNSLSPNDVGTWLFGRDGDASGYKIEEVPFDSIEGIEPSEYESVAEQLYNRSAVLQNRLELTKREKESGGQ